MRRQRRMSGRKTKATATIDIPSRHLNCETSQDDTKDKMLQMTVNKERVAVSAVPVLISPTIGRCSHVSVRVFEL